MSVAPPDHTLVAVLREVPGHRRVLRTRLGGEECVTRVLLTERVHPNQLPLIRRLVEHGRGSLVGVPEAIALTLEGYRVAARLDEQARRRPDGSAWWPKVLAVGLTTEQHVYITTSFLVGIPLHELATARLLEVRQQVAADVLEVLARLHAEHVAYGDLKTENVVVDPDGRAALIDLDTMREVPDVTTSVVTRDLTRTWAAPEQERGQQTYLASDVWAWAELVRRLYPEGSPWPAEITACQAADPLRRPHTVALLAAVTGHGGAEGLWDWLGRKVDPHAPSAPAPFDGPFGAPVEATERVADSSRATPVVPFEATERVADVTPAGPTISRSGEPFPGPTISRSGDPYLGPTISRSGDPLPSGPAGPGPHPALAPARSESGMTGCLQLVWGVSALATLVCLGFGGWGLVQYTTSASERVSELEAALETYKTDPALNTPAQRDELDRLGEHHTFAYEPPRWLALAALARAWAAGWQDTGRTWRDDDEERVKRIVDDLSGNDQPEAHLALATAQAAWCRVRPEDLTTDAHCEDALAEVSAFFASADGSSDLHWMRVEAAWTEVLVRSHLIDDGNERDLPPEDLPPIALPGLSRCDAAAEWLPYAPVNDAELLQDCLALAGAVTDLDRYRAYAGQLLGTDAPPLDRSTIRHLYTAAGPGCAATTVKSSKGDWAVKGDPWCVAVGHYARGCAAASLDVISRNAASSPDRPWATLQEVVAGLPGTTLCAR